MINKTLENLGLSSKEAFLYLKLIEIGTASAYEISKKTGLHHSTAYVILNGLMKKGLVTKYELSHTTKFSAEQPDRLFSFINKKKQELNQVEQELTGNLSELTATYLSSQTNPQVKLYMGKEGVEALERDADFDRLAVNDLYAFTPVDVLEQFKVANLIVNKRVQRKHKLKMIYTHLDGKKKLTSIRELREAKFLPKNKFPFDAAVVIAPNHSVRIFSYKNGFIGVWINNPDMANTFKIIFDICWSVAEAE